MSLQIIIERMRKAIDEQRLAIQHPEQLRNFLDAKEGASCLNHYPPEYFGGKDCHCIIGAALPLSKAKERPSVGVGYVRSDLPEVNSREFGTLAMLQSQHDELITDLRSIQGNDIGWWLTKRDEFLESIGS